MTIEWVINASSTHQGLLHRPRASAQSPRPSASSVGSSASSTRWSLQDPTLWVQGPYQLDTRCFNTISRVFNIISRVFSIVSKVVVPRSILVGTRTLSTGYKVLQDITHLCVGSEALDVRVLGSSIPVHCKRDLVASMTACGATASPMLASMTIQSTILRSITDSIVTKSVMWLTTWSHLNLVRCQDSEDSISNVLSSIIDLLVLRSVM